MCMGVVTSGTWYIFVRCVFGHGRNGELEWVFERRWTTHGSPSKVCYEEFSEGC